MPSLAMPGPERASPSTLVGLHERIAARAAAEPDAPAIIFEGHVTTYGELWNRAGRVAGGFADVGLERGERVGLLIRNMPEFYEVVLACLRLGVICVPLNTRLTPAELAEIVENSAPSALVSEQHFDAAFDALARYVMPARTYLIGDALAGYGLYDALAAPAPHMSKATALDEPLLVQYSSGTTGRPKGAMITHGNLVAAALSVAEVEELTASDRAALPVPLAYTGAIMSVSIPFLYAGASILIERQLDAEALLDHVERDGVTLLALVPVVFETMATSPTFADRNLSGLRLAVSGGAPVPEELLRTFQVRGLAMTQAYGITEGTGFNALLSASDALRKLGFAGLPLPRNEFRIVTDNGGVAAPGEVGELTIRGSMVMSGYWRNPQATAETLRDGWLHTGDLALLDEDGYLKIIDRKKDMLISGGLNVYPAEIERALFGHPGVVETAVVGVRDTHWGEVPVAFVVASDPALTVEALREFVRGLLADYKRPKYYVFTDALPRNMSGKILKRNLRELVSSLELETL